MAKPAKKNIAVLIVNKNGDPIVDANVVALNVDTGRTLELAPDQKGGYKAELVVGRYTVTATKTGYQDKSTELEVSDASPDPIDVNLTMEEEGTAKKIKVIVSNAKGEHLSDAEVAALNTATRESAPFLPKGEGLFEADLDVGKYKITAKKTGYQDKSTELEVSGASADPIEVNLTIEEDVMSKKIKVIVNNSKGEPISDAEVAALNTATQVSVPFLPKGEGLYEADVDVGKYTITTNKTGYKGKSTDLEVADISLDPIEVKINMEEKTVTEPPETGVEALLEELGKDEHSIEPKIVPTEAWQGIGLFSAVNFILAGKGEFNGGGVKKTDVLGIMKLFYGLQDKSLANKIITDDSQALWQKMDEIGLKGLALDLDRLQGDLDFMYREAKRQFNLGTNNSVLGNTQFPSLFKRYVEQGSDPLLSIDLKKARGSEFFDKEKLEKAYDLLRDLKETIIDIVRSLSKYGTSATFRVNKDWGAFLKQALLVLGEVAKRRVSEDQDEKNTWSVVAALTDQNREAITPYVSLGDHGASLLKCALQIYLDPKTALEDFDQDSLEGLFQEGNDMKNYWTTKIRTAARIVKRYPLPTWG